MEFHQIPKGNKYIFIGNNAFVIVLGIGTCKLDLWGSHTFYLHDVLYALEGRQNLMCVLTLL